MCNATFNNISILSWRSILLVEEIGVPGENHRPTASHWHTLYHNIVVSNTPRYLRKGTPSRSVIICSNIEMFWSIGYFLTLIVLFTRTRLTLTNVLIEIMSTYFLSNLFQVGSSKLYLPMKLYKWLTNLCTTNVLHKVPVTVRMVLS